MANKRYLSLFLIGLCICCIVCIIFTDIVGFSKMSMDVKPTKMMDMLQNLFNKFDELCDVHGVLKLE